MLSTKERPGLDTQQLCVCFEESGEKGGDRMTESVTTWALRSPSVATATNVREFLQFFYFEIILDL